MTVVIDQTYEVVRIDGNHDPLREHPKNPNKGVEGTIDESIDENGWYGAVTAQRSTGYILTGNHRYRVAKRKGATEIPVIWKDVDDETALKILTVDNKSTRDGEIDEAMMEELLDGLDNLKGTGYVLASVQEKIEDDASSAPPSESGGDDSDATLDPDDIPDDVYVPQFGVMIVCENEGHQKVVHDLLRSKYPKFKIQVVAV